MKPILEIQGISKKFIIRHESNSYLSLRDSLADFLKFKFVPHNQEEFWALRDVDFNVQQGESIGIIGRNGAGKSTLLKILSKITPPSSGKVIGRGRIACLLEVGTGFHPELSGRENIFLNGSILGMKRSEILKHFDAIVDFAGTEKFLDTSLKHYSSGMQLRLAFSVAAFLEPEILIIDEVLAVGDAEFQKKCLGKMEDVSKSGRTILFVSHNMASVSRLCNRAILLDQGRLVFSGSPEQAIHSYLKNKDVKTDQTISRALSKDYSVLDFKFERTELNPGDSLEYSFKLAGQSPNAISGLALLIYNELNERIGIVDLRSESLLTRSREQTELTFSGALEHLYLIDGVYNVGIYISSNSVQGDFYDLNSFHLSLPEGDIVPYDRQHRGYMSFQHQGQVK